MEFRSKVVRGFLIGIVVNIVLILLLKGVSSISFFEIIKANLLENLSIYDMFYTQISVSFIIITLVSVLSTTTRTVYWEDVAQYKLMNPKFSSFVDFTAYILSCLMVSLGCLVFKSNYIVVAFLIAIILMLVLTIKMIGAYFGREKIKEELKQKFNKKREDASKKWEDVDKQKALLEDYEKIKLLLIENTYKAIDSRDYQLVIENFDLLIENREYKDCEFIIENIADISCEVLVMILNKGRVLYDEESKDIERMYQKLREICLQKLMESNAKDVIPTSIYNIYLEERMNQIEIGCEKIQGKKDRREKEKVKNRFLKTGEYRLGELYENCLDNKKYKQIESFLKIFLGNFERIKQIIEKCKNDVCLAERIKQVYIESSEIEGIVKHITRDVETEEINAQQINAMLEVLLSLYDKIYGLEKDMDCYENLDDYTQSRNIKSSSSMVDMPESILLVESYQQLIEKVAEKRLLYEGTCATKYKFKSKFLKEILGAVEEKSISTM